MDIEKLRMNHGEGPVEEQTIIDWKMEILLSS
jgi:hypothetical protein